MAKKPTLGNLAYRARQMGERRVKRLQKYMESSLVGSKEKQIIRDRIKEINSAIQGTRQYSKTGKRYRSKSAKYISKQLKRLQSAIAETPALLRSNERAYRTTERQINMASAKRPSVYTKEQAQLFYRTTQEIWQREGVTEHERNKAIMDHVNAERLANGLAPATLSEIFDYVIKQKGDIIKGLNVKPQDDMTDEEREAYDKLAGADNADSDAGSPPGIGAYIISEIRDAFEGIFTADFSKD